MSNTFLGQIVMFAGNFAPRGFALCDGQLLSIAQNSALFSLLGTYYGGNGQTNFALPDLQSRLPLHYGQGAGLSYYNLGESGGAPSVTLTSANLPSHTHSLNATTGAASQRNIANTVLTGQTATNVDFYTKPVSGEPDPVQEGLNNAVCGMAGGGQAHSNLMPSLCLSFIIALQGVFQSRN